jgi:hypothetical protein
MTKFNPDQKAKLTYGEAMYPAMNITDKEDARQYLSAYAEYISRRHGITAAKARRIAKSNLITFAGNCSNETGLEVARIFGDL